MRGRGLLAGVWSSVRGGCSTRRSYIGGIHYEGSSVKQGYISRSGFPFAYSSITVGWAAFVARTSFSVWSQGRSHRSSYNVDMRHAERSTPWSVVRLCTVMVLVRLTGREHGVVARSPKGYVQVTSSYRGTRSNNTDKSSHGIASCNRVMKSRHLEAA